MKRVVRVTAALFVALVCAITAGPAAAQLADPLSPALGGVLLPFFSDAAAGFVSVFELASPIVPSGFTNPMHVVFFTATCDRDGSTEDVHTAKQAKAYVSTSIPFQLGFNGLAAFSGASGPFNFPVLSRVHWIDTKTGRLRELEPITLDTFFTLGPSAGPFVVNPGAGKSIGLCSTAGGSNNGFCWNPLRSAATFLTPQESPALKASLYLICPSESIQSPTGNGHYPTGAFPRLVNRDGTFGFLGPHLVTGGSVPRLRVRIYDDNEELKRDTETPCNCLTVTPVLSIDGIYATAPTNVGDGTVPVWYTELESTAQTNNTIFPTPQHNSFTGYYGLEVAGHEQTLFHRLNNASLDNISNGSPNPFANR